MKPPPAQSRATYIFKLEGPLDTLGKVQHTAGMSEPPWLSKGLERMGTPTSAVLMAMSSRRSQHGLQCNNLCSSLPSSEFPKWRKIFRGIQYIQLWVWTQLSHRVVHSTMTPSSTRHRINIPFGNFSTAHSATAQFCLVNCPSRWINHLNWSLRAFPVEFLKPGLASIKPSLTDLPSMHCGLRIRGFFKRTRGCFAFL